MARVRTALSLAMVVLTASAALVVAVGAGAGACAGDDDGGDAEPITGSAPSLQRWIVQLAGEPVDRAAYDKAAAQDPAAAAALVEGLRAQHQAAHKDFQTTVEAVGGKVVDWWWMSNAATIEIEAAGLPTIEKADGVKSVTPDRLLQ